jgi:hypothetical protein
MDRSSRACNAWRKRCRWTCKRVVVEKTALGLGSRCLALSQYPKANCCELGTRCNLRGKKRARRAKYRQICDSRLIPLWMFSGLTLESSGGAAVRLE